MIDPEHELSTSRQAKILGISRSSVYYRPRPPSSDDLELMRAIDRLHLEAPYAGSRMLAKLLRTEGLEVGRRHVRTLMRKMGIEALYRRRNTSRRHPGHEVFPYLLRGRTVTQANEAWALDITYIPMARGFIYFVGVRQQHFVSRLSRSRRGLEPDRDRCEYQEGQRCEVARSGAESGAESP